jgi:Aminoglycoside-2''-adenylyltransferase
MGASVTGVARRWPSKRGYRRKWVAGKGEPGQPHFVVSSSPGPPASAVPAAVAYVRDVLRDLGVSWLLSGGWAVDAWLGRQTREHSDVDITVFHDDQRAVFEHLSDWALVAHDPSVADDTTEQWNGRHLDLPAHIHVPTTDSSLSTSPARTHSAYEFEFLLNGREGHSWVLNPQAAITVALDASTRLSAWGVPTAPPEVVIFFKAGAHLTAAEIANSSAAPRRPRDEQDFLALRPALTDASRAWLHQSIAAARPQHPWLSYLHGTDQ